MNKQQVDIFVFYRNHHFHYLIRKCLKHFFDEILSQKISEIYFLSIGDQRGEHLKISVQTSAVHLLKLETIVNDTIQVFLKNSPSPSEPIKYPLNDVFLNFPNNSVQYNLFRNPSPILQSITFDRLKFSITKALMRWAKHGELDQDSLFMFTFQQQLYFLKCVLEKKNYAIVINGLYYKLFNSLNSNRQNVLNRFAHQLLENNSQQFQEMINFIWNHEIAESGEVPFEYLPLFHEDLSSTLFDKEFAQLTQLLYQQCNINDPNQLFISVALHKKLIKSFTNNYNLYLS